MADRRLKVRTGCITCKIRKVKCDEGKPACKRCTDTGRSCDGYRVPDDVKKRRPTQGQAGQRRTSEASSTRSAPALEVDAAWLSPTLDADERQWLLYFSRRTGPGLLGLADTPFWRHMLLQLSVSEPAIRHAMLALGSSHAHFQAESVADRAMAAQAVGREFPLKHYNLAIVCLQRQLSGLKRPRKVEVPLICCLLFICLECLYGNRRLVLTHLRNGLNILHSADANFSSPTRQKLCDIFCRLDVRSTLFGKAIWPPSDNLIVGPTSLQPSTFRDLSEAQHWLDIISASTLHFVKSIRDNPCVKDDLGCSAPLLQRHLQEQLLAWKNGLDQLEESSSSGHATCDHRAIMLRIEHSATFIYLSNCFEVEQTCYDSFKAVFADIVRWARMLFLASSDPPAAELPSLPKPSKCLASSSLSSTFSLDACLTPVLFMTAIKCRDPLIRREAISLLRLNPVREGLWDADLHARIARRVVEIEEGSMLVIKGATQAVMEEWPSLRMRTSDGSVLQDPPKASCRVHRVHFNRASDELSRSAPITFYTLPDDTSGEWMVWEETIAS